MSQFVTDLPATLIIEPVKGGRIPGISCRSQNGAVIGIDESIMGTSLYLPVVAHELAHLLLEDEGIWLCAHFGTQARADQSWASQTERNAWFGAALLTISDHQMHKFHTGKADATGLAAESLVPLEMVNLRHAVYTAVRHPLAVNEHAAHLAYKLWQTYLTAQLRRSATHA